MWRKNNSIHITSWFVITLWRGRLCDKWSFRHLLLLPVMLLWVRRFGSGLFSVWLGYVWQDLCCCISVTSRFDPLGFNIACLLSLERRAGMRGMQASGLPVYSEGFLHCPPSASFEGFFTFLCSLLFREQVTGEAHGSLLWHSWISVWSGSAGILSYSTYCPFHTHLRYFYSCKLNSMTECHHFILLYWAETW